MRLAVAIAMLLVACAVPGCFLVSDVDRFHADGGSGGAGDTDDPTQPSSLALSVLGARPHLNELIEFRVVDKEDFVQCRVLIDPIDEPSTDEVTFHVRNAIPSDNGPYRLDFYGDVNGSGDYDGLPAEGDVLRDHAWRIDPLADFPAGQVPHVANLVQVTFHHNIEFTDIGNPSSAGADVILRFGAEAMSRFQGHLLEARIVQDHEPYRTVGVYRNPAIPDQDFEARIRGMVEINDSYTIDVYIDENGNGKYDNPAEGGDGGWRFSATAELAVEGGAGAGGGEPGQVGIDMTFDPTAPSDVDVGEP